MAYVLPSLKVYQEFVPVLAGNFVPLNACVVAPQYALHRFEYEDERELLGAYSVTAGNVFTSWPGKTAGSEIDVANAELWAEDAVLRYAVVNPMRVTVAGGTRVRSATWIFKTANGFDRSGDLGTRDVQIGDYVAVASGAGTVLSKVVALVADVIPAVVDAVAEGSVLASTSVAGYPVITESLDAVDIAADTASYNGLADGDPTETYTCTVLTAPTSGAVTGATVRVVSTSGNDDVASVVLTDGVAVALGTRGATMTISTTSSSSGSLEVDDQWVIEVGMTYTKTSPTEGGTYTGARDTRYLITFLTGGTVHTDVLRYVVTTSNGYDISPIRTIAAGGSGSVAIPVGNYGVTLTFAAAAQICGGSIWTIDVTAEADGAVRTIQLANRLTGILTSEDLSVTLGLYDTIEVGEGNWTASTSAIEIIPDATYLGAYLGTEGDSFPILAGDLYISYRELITTNTGTIFEIEDLDAIEDIAGPISADNPLGMMVYAALTQSNGVPVYCLATAGSAAADYIAACDILAENEDVYSLVPYDSDDADVRTALQTHVNDMADPLIARFRIAWFGLNNTNTRAISTETVDGAELEVTIDGLTASAVGGQFVTDGVRPGDVLRTNYQLSGTGDLIYDSYVVDVVVAEDELTLLTGPAAPIVVAIKAEVWRTLTNAEYAAELGAVAVTHKSRRIYCVWSEDFTLGSYTDLPKSVLAAALAGQRSGVAPHQPLTNVELSSITLENSLGMAASSLNTMAGLGVWIVTRDIDGTVYTRHQVSTDPTDVNTREQTITTNLDNVVRQCRDNVSDLYGRGNATPEMLRLIKMRLVTAEASILSRSYSPTIGPQLLAFEITKLEIDPLIRDAVICEIEPVLPYPLNNLTLRFRIV